MAPFGIVVENQGKIFVSDPAQEAIIAVSPDNGNRALFSGKNNGSGKNFVLLAGISVDQEGNILVIDAGQGKSSVEAK